MSRRVRPLIERLLEKVSITEAGCWEFSGATGGVPGPTGHYGHISEGRRGASVIGAHRASFLFFHGPIPEGHDVAHSCDNPPCVNPDHLAAKTRRQNLLEMRAKGRARGCTVKEFA